MVSPQEHGVALARELDETNSTLGEGGAKGRTFSAVFAPGHEKRFDAAGMGTSYESSESMLKNSVEEKDRSNSLLHGAVVFFVVFGVRLGEWVEASDLGRL